MSPARLTPLQRRHLERLAQMERVPPTRVEYLLWWRWGVVDGLEAGGLFVWRRGEPVAPPDAAGRCAFWMVPVLTAAGRDALLDGAP